MKIDVRILSLCNVLFAGMWHVILLTTRRRGENTAVILQALFYLLPLITLVFSLILLDSREGDRWAHAKWLWPAAAAGFSPFVTFGIYVAVSK
jgi:hypothetical protein